MKRFVALLRGINVTGRNKIPMLELKQVCAGLGWKDVATYIQSGNVGFSAPGTAAALEAALEGAIQQAFGLSIPVVVRSREEWERIAAANPFRKVCETQAKLVMCVVGKLPFRKELVAELAPRAAAGERIERAGEALWIHFPEGVARSKLTPAAIDKAAGSPMTARNWNTVVKLLEI